MLAIMRVRSCVAGKEPVLQLWFWDLVLLKHCARFLLLYDFIVSLVSWIVKVDVVFLAGLRASARMTACCACLGVGFHRHSSFLFCFLRVQAFARTSKSHTSSFAEVRSRSGQLLPATLSSILLQDEQSGDH